jgi:hypothetical protein
MTWVLAGKQNSCYTRYEKQTNTNTHKITSTQTVIKAKRIKLGIDVHADSHQVVRQVDEATPQGCQWRGGLTLRL